jgi:hypothetical protein
VPTEFLREVAPTSLGRGYGTPLDHEIKRSMLVATNALLSTGAGQRQGLLDIPDDCLAGMSNYAIPQPNLATVKSMLYDQFRNFKILPTGKFSGKEGGKNDDLVIAFMMTVYWSQFFCGNFDPSRSYSNFRRELEAADQRFNYIWAAGADCLFHNAKSAREDNAHVQR